MPSILNIGIDSYLTQDEIKRYRIINGICFFGGIVLVVTSIVVFIMTSPFEKIDYEKYKFFFSENFELKALARNNLKILFPIMDFILGIFLLFNLYLNHKKKFNISVLLICVFTTIFASVFFLFSGITTIYFFFFPAILPILFYNNKKTYSIIWLLNYLILITLLVILNKFNNLGFISNSNLFVAITINITVSFVVIYLFVNSLKSESIRSEENILAPKKVGLKLVKNNH
jgi:hypothetical protein